MILGDLVYKFSWKAKPEDTECTNGDVYHYLKRLQAWAKLHIGPDIKLQLFDSWRSRFVGMTKAKVEALLLASAQKDDLGRPMPELGSSLGFSLTSPTASMLNGSVSINVDSPYLWSIVNGELPINEFGICPIAIGGLIDLCRIVVACWPADFGTLYFRSKRTAVGIKSFEDEIGWITYAEALSILPIAGIRQIALEEGVLYVLDVPAISRTDKSQILTLRKLHREMYPNPKKR